MPTRISQRRLSVLALQDRSHLIARFLRVIAVAVMTLACAGVTSQSRGTSRTLVVVEATTAAVAKAVGWAATAAASQGSRERPTLRADLREVEPEVDGDSDVSCVPVGKTLALGELTSPCGLGRTGRWEAPRLASRFAIRTGLARAPPAI